jgi:ABC-2 type transport system ATP-binding protein
VAQLLELADVVQMRASGLKLSDELRRDLGEVIRKHGGNVEIVSHPTTTLEEYFLRIVRESQAHPGRRYLPARERDGKTESAKV